MNNAKDDDGLVLFSEGSGWWVTEAPAGRRPKAKANTPTPEGIAKARAERDEVAKLMGWKS